MILITKSYERFESHDEYEDFCEPDETGFSEEATPYTFREVVEMIRHGEPNQRPITRAYQYNYVTLYETNNGTREYYEQGVRENESIFYAHENPARNAKWWTLAWRVAGLTR